MAAWRVPFPFIFINGRGSSSSKNQNHFLNQRRNLMVRPGWWQSWNGGMYGGLKILGVAWLSSSVVFPVQCGESCWSETGSSLWNSGVNEVSGKSGECVMGCNYPCVSVSWHMLQWGASVSQREAQATVVDGWEVWCVPTGTAAALVAMGKVAWLWSVEMSPMSVPIMGGVWYVPLGVGVLWPWTRPVFVTWCFWWWNPVGAVLCKV